MKVKFIFCIAFFSLLSTAVTAQEIIKCPAGKTFWIFKKDSKNYAVTLEKEKVKTNSNAVTLNGIALKFEIIEPDTKKHSQEPELNILITYFSALAANNRIPGTSLESTFTKNDAGKPILIISGGSGISASTVINNKILTISTQLPKKENKKGIAATLEDIVATAVLIDKKEKLCAK